MFMNNYTLEDLMRALYQSEFDTSKSETNTRRPLNTDSVGNIYTEDSINEALRTNENEVIELQRKIDAKNRANEALRIRLNSLKNQTKLVKNGSNVAVTMSRTELSKLIEQLGNILNNSDADRLTFTLENVN